MKGKRDQCDNIITITSETEDSSLVPEKPKAVPTPITIDPDMYSSPIPVKKKIPGPVIIINSSSEENTPTSSKRKSGSDSDPGSTPLKKFKGKGKENAAPTFHHPKALTKKDVQRAAQKVTGKITAKVSKVSECIFMCIIHVLKVYRQIDILYSFRLYVG